MAKEDKRSNDELDKTITEEITTEERTRRNEGSEEMPNEMTQEQSSADPDTLQVPGDPRRFKGDVTITPGTTQDVHYKLERGDAAGEDAKKQAKK